MRRWLSSVDWTTKRVFIITWVAALVVGAPYKASVEVYWVIREALRGPVPLSNGHADQFDLVLICPANALLWATLITVACASVALRRGRRSVRPRRAMVTVFVVVAVVWFVTGIAPWLLLRLGLRGATSELIVASIMLASVFPIVPLLGEKLDSTLNAFAAKGDSIAIFVTLALVIAACALIWATVIAGIFTLAPKLRSFWASQ